MSQISYLSAETLEFHMFQRMLATVCGRTGVAPEPVVMGKCSRQSFTVMLRSPLRFDSMPSRCDLARSSNTLASVMQSRVVFQAFAAAVLHLHVQGHWFPLDVRCLFLWSSDCCRQE
ncbi:unnamed protein product [Symbiodinium sp. CCMP2456]|nr:unnamed protein product [Symbiodinium sp. CCMP2456]